MKSLICLTILLFLSACSSSTSSAGDNDQGVEDFGHGGGESGGL